MNEQNPEAAQRPSSTFRFAPCDSAAFAEHEYRHAWLVERILTEGQLAVVGGSKKMLKTNVSLDLGISVGSGTPFLNKFVVPRKARVAILSGESGPATLQETARRICHAKGIELRDCDVLWQTDLPQLSDAGDRDRLREGLAEAGVKLVVIDPLFLCLLGGVERAAASNLYEIGPLLLRAARACLDAGATPVLLHHATKAASKKAEGGEVPDPEDLAFAGVGEFARQWLLLGRREPYRPGTGRHALTMAVGGSAGHSSVWHLDVDEDVIGPDGTGRVWKVRVAEPELHEVVPTVRVPAMGKKTRTPW